MTVNKATVVIGAGYGDEGKGLFTQYFASQNKLKSNMVIRFNGGAQAGHTVINKKGIRHVFGHFTANSFLDNSKGYLSKHFIVNPLVYNKELQQLNAINTFPIMACHSECYITTPYDMVINQWLEFSRGNSSKHGSCGLGIGETVHRNEIAKKTFQIKDIISDDNIKERITLIREFFILRVKELGLSDFLNKNENILSDILIENFIEDINKMKKTLILGVDFLNHEYFENSDIIFEGAQGLLLDQTMGDFPHVTRSNTGLKNVIEICSENNITHLDVLYATRCYKTRHGAGNLNHELKEKPYENIKDETNIHNQFQGSLRFAYLDIEELNNTINLDIISVNDSSIYINKMIGISCLDQTDIVSYYKKDELHNLPNFNFYTLFSKEYEVFECWSADGETIKNVF